ncbi:recombinase RecA [Armatimonadetes bacterium Uphvl-Ar1]|jgi:recombination protein RecA|nr:recombinase RecA [Armatimonadetes bacterium Uphvl-Ar1]
MFTTKEKIQVPPEKNPNADREKALELALQQIEKSFGKGSVMQLGGQKADKIAAIPTGSLALDVALGIGGIPRSRIIEIYGAESSGKTTVSLQIIAEAQKLGGMALFIDAEHALDLEYAKVLGVDTDRLYVSQPNTGEEALEIMEGMIRSGAMDIVVLDSVAALVPKAEIEGDMGDSHVGLQARMMSQAMRKIGGVVNKTKTSVVFINQIREKIGVMFGNPETTPGGRALKFWASCRLEVRRGEFLKNGTEAFGARTKVKVVKNKVAPPFRQAEFDIIFGKGISTSGDILDLAVQNEIVNRAGTYYNYGETRLGQGRDNAKNFLEENPTLMTEIDQKVRGHLGLPTTPIAPVEFEALVSIEE